MATAKIITGLVQHCQTYDAASFEGLVLPSLVLRSDHYQRGELVIYIEKPRHTWKGRYFAGKVVRPADLWLQRQRWSILDVPIRPSVVPVKISQG